MITDKMITDKMITDKITSDKIATGKITADKITTDKITSGKIITDKMITDKLSFGIEIKLQISFPCVSHCCTLRFVYNNTIILNKVDNYYCVE